MPMARVIICLKFQSKAPPYLIVLMIIFKMGCPNLFPLLAVLVQALFSWQFFKVGYKYRTRNSSLAIPLKISGSVTCNVV